MEGWDGYGGRTSRGRWYDRNNGRVILKICIPCHKRLPEEEERIWVLYAEDFIGKGGPSFWTDNSSKDEVFHRKRKRIMARIWVWRLIQLFIV